MADRSSTAISPYSLSVSVWAAQTLAAHPGIAASTAWTEGRVFYLDPATWYIATGGYQGLMKTLEDFAAAQ